MAEEEYKSIFKGKIVAEDGTPLSGVNVTFKSKNNISELIASTGETDISINPTTSDVDIKGIDTPVFQISVFSTTMANSFNTANDILQALHGYSGTFGNPSAINFPISKADVVWLYNGYDNEINLFSIFMDCTLYIPT